METWFSPLTEMFRTLLDEYSSFLTKFKATFRELSKHQTSICDFNLRLHCFMFGEMVSIYLVRWMWQKGHFGSCILVKKWQCPTMVGTLWLDRIVNIGLKVLISWLILPQALWSSYYSIKRKILQSMVEGHIQLHRYHWAYWHHNHKEACYSPG